MKKRVLKAVFALLTVALICQLTTCKLQQLAATSEGFNEDNYLYYTLFIDPEIKNIPRITDSYYFTFSEMDGPKPETSSVIFRGRPDIGKIEKYLKSIGYHPGDAGSDKNESRYQRWSKSPSATDEIRVFVDDDITVTKYRY